ncbi:dynamin family protein [Pseudomonas aeruginosa]|uniref:dynamin family protein n=1 Tax=Pseudomonas aeruginosa TaxID=287 RepID=UPI002358C758|nr:dynamin family protein [Pseudomonas aeruginosa]MDC9031577.1 hypothetical protein [Pseudomonas aeruginosa]MED6067829.1 dynamin family protein [Pseudomonas aeruginosa]
MTTPPRLDEQALPTLKALSRFWQFKRKKLAADLLGYLNDAQQQMDELYAANQQVSAQRALQQDEIAQLQSRSNSLAEQLQAESVRLASTAKALDLEKSKLHEALQALAQANTQFHDARLRESQALTRIAELEQQLTDQQTQLSEKAQFIDELQQTLTEVRQQLDALRLYKRQLTEQCTDQATQIQTLEVRSQELASQLQVEQANTAILEERKSQALAQITELEAFLEDNRNQLLSKEQSVCLLESMTEQLKASHQHLENNYADINKQHLSLIEKFSLVSRVLAQQPPSNPGLERFAELINNDYMDFANRESSLADEAQAVLKMQAILAEMHMLNNFPSIAGKTILSIAGGFSSGKSAFVNSFIKDPSVELATGINPVTVIPSYVVCSEETQIKGYSYNGGALDLEPSLYASMSHEYVQAFGFDLRRILPFISVKVPMDPDLFGNLCIIDTPGYNPGNSLGAQASDRVTAASLINQASAMIWVIGLDPAGTIDQSDIEFIQSSPFRDESLYIVLNKADVKSEEDIRQIINQVALDLEFAGIDYAGISAYSSTRRRTYPSSGISLDQFLRSINHKVDVVDKVNRKINAVFDSYKKAIEADIAELEKRQDEFNAFKLDALEIGGTELFDRIDKAFPLSKQILDTSVQKKLEQECENLRRALKIAAQKALLVQEPYSETGDFQGSCRVSVSRCL